MLEQIRGERNLDEIADEIDVAISTVQRWEKGSMAIPSFRLPAIAKAYRCSIADIFAEDDDVAQPDEKAQWISFYQRMGERERKTALGMVQVLVEQAKK